MITFDLSLHNVFAVSAESGHASPYASWVELFITHASGGVPKAREETLTLFTTSPLLASLLAQGINQAMETYKATLAKDSTNDQG